MWEEKVRTRIDPSLCKKRVSQITSKNAIRTIKTPLQTIQKSSTINYGHIINNTEWTKRRPRDEKEGADIEEQVKKTNAAALIPPNIQTKITRKRSHQIRTQIKNYLIRKETQ
jgi:hypothetical protein